MQSDFRLGPWLVRPGLNTVSQSGSTTRLEPKVMEVLVCLAAFVGEPVSKETILKTVWPGTFVSDDVLTRSISELRRVLDDDPREPRFIQTIPKRGYRLLCAVRPGNGVGRAVKPLADLKLPVRSKRNLKAAGLAVASTLLACGLLLGLTNGTFRKRVFVGNQPRIRSLAVLPFKNLSDDPKQGFFASGMTEELITDLSQISALKVISRTSSDVYEDTHKTLPEIARELQVDAVIEGSVVRSGNRVRVTAQLIYAPEDKNLWARSYERDVEDALALQGTLATAIADEIRVQVAPNTRVRINSPRSVSASVLESYLQGNYHLHRVGRQGSTDEEAHRAADDFQRAIDQDPDFAPAYLGLAYAHAPILRATTLLNSSPRDYQIRKAAAEKAAALDPDSSAAHILLASIACEDWQWSRAEEELRQAIALNPNDGESHDAFGTFLFAMGRGEAGEKEMEIAQALDPNVDHLSGFLGNLGKYDEAISLLLRDLSRQPDDGQAHYDLFQTYALAGKYQEAIDQLEEAGRLFGLGDLTAPLEDKFRSAGFKPAIRLLAQNIEKLQSEHKVYMPGVLSQFYCLVGDKDRAFYWLEDAYRHRHNPEGGLFWLKGDPTYAVLRSDPRYANLLRRVGLPQ